MKKFTYLFLLICGGCSLWQKGNGSYDVYVDDSFDSSTQNLIRKAVQKWQDSISYDDGEAPVTFHYTPDWKKENELITVSPSSIQALTNLYGNKETDNEVIGNTTFEGTSSLIQISMEQPDFEQCMQHELGHALGLQHTLPGELMYHSRNGAAEEVTCKDVEQFCSIWGCNAFDLNGCK